LRERVRPLQHLAGRVRSSGGAGAYRLAAPDATVWFNPTWPKPSVNYRYLAYQLANTAILTKQPIGVDFDGMLADLGDGSKLVIIVEICTDAATTDRRRT
jgi:hypothetical protein